MNDENLNISADSLLEDIKSFAIAKAQYHKKIHELQTENEKLKNLVSAYEDKEKLEKGDKSNEPG